MQFSDEYKGEYSEGVKPDVVKRAALVPALEPLPVREISAELAARRLVGTAAARCRVRKVNKR